MKKLLSTTALVVALGFPAMTLAQTTSSDNRVQQQGEMSGFLSERGQADLFASELMGHNVYARQTTADRGQSGDRTALSGDRSRDMATMNRDSLNEMDHIGQINEIVLSHDGRIRALVIGVGGFLGMGEHDIAVSMDEVTFASDTDDRSQMYVVLNTRADMLRDAPAYDRTAALGSDTRRDDRARDGDRPLFAAPDMQRDGYNRTEARNVSTEMLMGQSVYDVNDNDVGSVHDMIISQDGSISHVIIDFGGFLGIGSSQAALHFDELTFLATEGNANVRIYVDATRDQIRGLPQYVASN